MRDQHRADRSVDERPARRACPSVFAGFLRAQVDAAPDGAAEKREGFVRTGGPG